MDRVSEAPSDARSSTTVPGSLLPPWELRELCVQYPDAVAEALRSLPLETQEELRAKFDEEVPGALDGTLSHAGRKILKGSRSARFHSKLHEWPRRRSESPDSAKGSVRDPSNEPPSPSSTTSRLPAPPQLYVDDRTIIREVSDLTALRAGDHLLITLNVARTVHPWLDALHGQLGRFGLFPMYHHMILLNDVASVDEHNVPRAPDGRLAMVFEYANTPAQAWREALRDGFVSLLMRKTSAHKTALVDYGDTGVLFRVEESLSDEDRAKILANCENALETHPWKYHAFLSNCEHSTNALKGREFASPQVPNLLFNSMRVGIAAIGLAALYRHDLTSNTAWLGMAGIWLYYFFTIVPVALQTIVHIVRIQTTLNSRRGELGHNDYWHLTAKEGSRNVLTMGFTIAFLVYAPSLKQEATDTLSEWLLGFGVLFAYSIANFLFNALAGLVVVVLLRTAGKVWLIGGPKNKVD